MSLTPDILHSRIHSRIRYMERESARLRAENTALRKTLLQISTTAEQQSHAEYERCTDEIIETLREDLLTLAERLNE